MLICKEAKVPLHTHLNEDAKQGIHFGNTFINKSAEDGPGSTTSTLDTRFTKDSSAWDYLGNSGSCGATAQKY